MESAENREQSPKANQPEKSSSSLPLSKTETIKLLNDSIDKLESTIKEISKNTAQDLPSPNSIETLLNTTQELADSVTRQPTSTDTSVTTSSEESVPPSTPEIIDEKVFVEEKPAVSTVEVKPLKEKSNLTGEVESTEAKSIPAAKIKSQPAKNDRQKKPTVKPSDKNIAKTKKKESRGLIIIGAVAIAIAAIALGWLYFPQIKTSIFSTPQPTEIIVDRNLQPDLKTTDIPVADRNLQSDPKTNDIPVVDADEDIILDSQDVSSPDVLETEIEPETTAPTAIPQDLTSPERAKNIKIKTIEPELTFTPEQKLIAALQTKLAEITQNLDSDLLENIKVDLPQARLLVEVTDNWYELSESRQDKLANDILKRTRQLNFNKLEILDSTGTLVARNPVVGDRAIILESSKNYQNPA